MTEVLVSDILRRLWTLKVDEFQLAHRAYRHVVTWIKNPDKGSKFERSTRFIRWLPGIILIPLLLWTGRTGIIFLDERSKIAGHVFFQIHPDAVHMFSIYVREDLRYQGLAEVYMREFLTHVYETTSLRLVRLGAGGHEAVQKLWKKARNLDLTFHVVSHTLPEEGLDGWVRLCAA